MNPGAVVCRMTVLLALMTATHRAHAAEGVVIWRNYDCGFFILQTKAGYGLYEWVAGPYPNESDVIEGELQSRENTGSTTRPPMCRQPFSSTLSRRNAAIFPRAFPQNVKRRQATFLSRGSNAF